MPKRPVSPLTFLVITTALFQALLLAAKTTVAELHVVNLLLRNQNSALTAILLALLSFASTAAGATAATGAAATGMLVACLLSAATIAPYLTLVKDAFRIGRAGALFAAIPVRFPFMIVALFLGVLCFVLALIKAVKTFAKLFIESRREGMRLWCQERADEKETKRR